MFSTLYNRSLVYNACWEDPAVDRQALELSADDSLLVITSAGCNVLDYALTGPRRIYAVDANPRQTALLELKIAGIRSLEHADFFQLFGTGVHPRMKVLYHDVLRAQLCPFAQHFWDRRLHWFSPRGQGFYFHGLAGTVAQLFRTYLRLRPRLAQAVATLFEADTLDAQRQLYQHHIAPLLWTKPVRWALSRQATLSLLGVPHPQRAEVIAQHPQGVPGFVRTALEYLVEHVLFRDNYFYAVYVCGEYSRACCPEYLKPRQFAALKAGLVDRIELHTTTVTNFLRRGVEPITRFVLLDHMDWMSSYLPSALADEWAEIGRRAAPSARVIFRSAHAEPRYLRELRVGTARRRLSDLLSFDRARATVLARADRVHTYAGFHIGTFASCP